MVRLPNQIEEESLQIIFENVLEVFDKHGVSAQYATSVALAIINMSVHVMWELNPEQKEKLADQLAITVNQVITDFLNKERIT